MKVEQAVEVYVDRAEGLIALDGRNGPRLLLDRLIQAGPLGLIGEGVQFNNQIKAIRNQGIVVVEKDGRYWLLPHAPSAVAMSWAQRFTERQITETSRTSLFFHEGPEMSARLARYAGRMETVARLADGANSGLTIIQGELAVVR